MISILSAILFCAFAHYMRNSEKQIKNRVLFIKICPIQMPSSPLLKIKTLHCLNKACTCPTAHIILLHVAYLFDRNTGNQLTACEISGHLR